ncbi:MAG: DUF4844 domain-containing protein [bacterium]|nr:DUF4844 domain-containing protein [bacterium]
MLKYLSTLVILSITLIAYSQNKMETPSNAIDQLTEFKKKEKFVADNSIMYPGAADPEMKAKLTELMNLAADDFIEVARDSNPTEELYHKKMELGLSRFSNIYLETDTEDRERVCGYFEELMDIVLLESSGGQLNKFMYGF